MIVHTQIVAQIVAITPKMAEQWLEKNTRNRPLRDATVKKYADDMRAGRWKLSPDAVAFSDADEIVNGQHRLWAIFESGRTITMAVMRGLDPSIVNVLDDHLKRRLTDIIKLGHPGLSVTNKHAAVAAAMQEVAYELKGIEGSVFGSRQEQIDYVSKHYPAIDFAVRECFNSSGVRALAQASVMEPVARAYYTEDRERLKAFGRMTLTGAIENTHDDAGVLLLRGWLTRGSTTKTRLHRMIIRRKTERALRAFLDREYLTKLFEADEPTLFILAEERAVMRKHAGARRDQGLAVRAHV
jgi:hypothetical protein